MSLNSFHGSKRSRSTPVGIDIICPGGKLLFSINCSLIASPVVTILCVRVLYTKELKKFCPTGVERCRVRTKSGPRLEKRAAIPAIQLSLELWVLMTSGLISLKSASSLRRVAGQSLFSNEMEVVSNPCSEALRNRSLSGCAIIMTRWPRSLMPMDSLNILISCPPHPRDASV